MKNHSRKKPKLSKLNGGVYATELNYKHRKKETDNETIQQDPLQTNRHGSLSPM